MNLTSIKKALVAVCAVALFAGCAATSQNVYEGRAPAELYEKAMDLYLTNKHTQAEKALTTLMEEHPLSPLATDAQLLLGDVNYTSEKYEEAGSYYTNFVAMHPSHPRAAYALFQKGMSHFKNILSIDRDQTSTNKALFAFEDLVISYPDSPYREKADELITFLRKRLAEREYYVANFYYKKSNYDGALARFSDLLRTYPDSGLTEKTLYYMGEAYRHMGEQDMAEEAYSTLISNFPDSGYTEDARSRLDDMG